ncbi:MAG: hypothetical protein U0168_03680 [Nannocystaceae bacterium]
MNAATRILGCFLLLTACDQGGDDHDGGQPVGVGTYGPQGGGADQPFDQPGDDAQDRCEDVTRAYADLLYGCYPDEVSASSDEDVATVCDLARTPESVWVDCPDEVAAFTACGEQVGCDAWYGGECWDSQRAMMICFGEPDPGAEPPGCAYTNDGECDEPEGTGVCADGSDEADCAGGGGEEAPSCDPTYCSGCEGSCDDYGCYQCCWSCNGDSCEQSCNF